MDASTSANDETNALPSVTSAIDDPTTTSTATTTTTTDQGSTSDVPTTTTIITTTTSDTPTSAIDSATTTPNTTTEPATSNNNSSTTTTTPSSSSGMPSSSTTSELSSTRSILTSSTIDRALSSSMPTSTTTSTEIMTSSPVPIVSVSSSGSVHHTFTSTSYSSYRTTVPTVVSNAQLGSSSSNTGAIAGGVVGGIAGLALIAGIAFILMKRRRNKKKNSYGNDNDVIDSGGKHAVSPQFNHYYETPTMLSENNSQPALSATNVIAASSQGTKPRPFVQAYDPAGNYPEGGRYYNDYNNNAGYDPYYSASQQSTVVPHGGRNVPDEIDTNTPARRLSRHVPDEV